MIDYAYTATDLDLFVALHHVQRKGHIAMGRLLVEEPMYTSWSRFCTVNHWASRSNYQVSKMKSPD